MAAQSMKYSCQNRISSTAETRLLFPSPTYSATCTATFRRSARVFSYRPEARSRRKSRPVFIEREGFRVLHQVETRTITRGPRSLRELGLKMDDTSRMAARIGDRAAAHLYGAERRPDARFRGTKGGCAGRCDHLGFLHGPAGPRGPDGIPGEYTSGLSLPRSRPGSTPETLWPGRTWLLGVSFSGSTTSWRCRSLSESV